jgi:hypothetical protein
MLVVKTVIVGSIPTPRSNKTTNYLCLRSRDSQVKREIQPGDVSGPSSMASRNILELPTGNRNRC